MEKKFNANSLLIIILLGVNTWGLTEIIGTSRTVVAFIAEQRQVNVQRQLQIEDLALRIQKLEERTWK